MTVAPVELTESQTKKRSFKAVHPLGHLLPYLKRYPFMLGLTIFALLVASLATLALPFASRLVIDHGISTTDGAGIDAYFQLLIFIVSLLALGSALRFYCVYWLGERLVADLKADVFKKLVGFSAQFFDANHSGELMSRLAADTTLINSAIRASVSQALRNGVVLIGGLVMMVITSAQLSVMVILAIPIIVLPLMFYGRMVRRLSNTAQDTMAELNKFGAEMLSNIRTVQAFNAEEVVTNRFTQTNELTVLKAMVRTKARAFLTAIAIFLVMVSIVLILWYGAHDVISGDMSGGTLVQFMLYAVFAGGSLGALTEVWGEIAQAAGAAERLSEFLNHKSELKTPAKLKKFESAVQGKIDFVDVGFSYPARSDETVLTDVNLSIKPGERIAIVGASGAGKSTIFQLLLRFYDPTKGSIRVDGVPVNELDLHELRDCFALVPQEASLFDASILENIAFARSNVSKETADTALRDEVIKAAKAAQAHEFIEGFSEGYETRIGEGGQGLSGGQRQRIALARAILRQAPILLLDEATSALDAGSEEKVQQALEEVLKGRTSLIIAHRLSTVVTADRILVFDQGRFVEEGTHNELLSKGGIYAELARTQLQRDGS
ncbi:MAG: ABC transporter [Methyloligella sp.]|nr:MAG: ABC transporter [Methyloligella sp.]